MLREEKIAAILSFYASGGGTTVRKLGGKYGYSFGTVAKLIRKGNKERAKLALLSSAQAAMSAGHDLPVDVKLLQEELRKAQLKISLLEAMIDISDEEHGTDIRKNWYQAIMRVEQSGGGRASPFFVHCLVTPAGLIISAGSPASGSR